MPVTRRVVGSPAGGQESLAPRERPGALVPRSLLARGCRSQQKSCQRRARDLLDDVVHSQVFAFLSGQGRDHESSTANGVPCRPTGSHFPSAS